ncbi:MAG: DUF2147 domain-containing protein [Pseudomonadota bacterium]
MISLKKIILLLLSIFIISGCDNTFAVTSAKQSNTEVTGYWQIPAKGSNKPSAVVKVYIKNNKLYANIVKMYPINGKPPVTYCQHCKGELRNAKFIGLPIFWNLKKEKGKWRGGKILNPKTGKTYSCTVSLTQDGKALSVRGHIGMFGVTKIWPRAVNFKETNDSSTSADS